MSLEEMFIAHWIISWLLPDELEELANLLENAKELAPWDCGVPLRELQQRIVHEFGEDCQAARQLESLIL